VNAPTTFSRLRGQQLDRRPDVIMKQSTVLTDAELVLGLSRHLSAYATSPAKAALENLEFSGQIGIVRLTGAGGSIAP
jgi:hypothetical protein